MTIKQTNVYVTFDGNCSEAFDFYKEIFGGDFSWKATFGNSPFKDKTPEDMHDHIMHMSLPIGKHFELMGSDRNPVMHKNEHTVGNNTQIALTMDTKEETDRIYEALVKDGTQTCAPADMFWGAYHGSCTDKFGVQWMLDCPANASKDGKNEALKEAAKALLDAASLATDGADKLESLIQEPDAKKQRLENGAN
jgi:PhnB protein